MDHAEGHSFNTAIDLFTPLGSREYYRTDGFNELALSLATSMSYRKVTTFFNRVRWETETGTPMRTLAHVVETEGQHAQEALNDLAEDVLTQQKFNPEGTPKEGSEPPTGLAPKEASLPAKRIAEAMEHYNQDKGEGFRIDAIAATSQLYENPEVTVNVSIDDVGVKKQKETGRSTAKPRKEKREYVHNTIAHVEKKDCRYVLNGSSTPHVLKLLIAFLLYNHLLRGHHLQFFVDGARSLQACLVSLFQWLPHVRIILDWYHLKKKCEYELSLVLKGAKIRNTILDQLLPLMWLGKLDDAIAFLQQIQPEKVKSGQSVDRLIGYFERNRDYIPCYALRKQLGLRNSSNRGEKANDLCVAERQKHNGMSWSKKGSVALATVISLHLNNEQDHWRSNHKLSFSWAS